MAFPGGFPSVHPLELTYPPTASEEAVPLGTASSQFELTPETFPVRNGDHLALAPKTIANDVARLLTTLATKVKNGEISPKTLEVAVKELVTFERQPATSFTKLISSLRSHPLGVMLLRDPEDQNAKNLAVLSLSVAVEKGALPNAAIVNAGSRLLSLAKQEGLLAPGVSPEKIRATLQPPIREALQRFAKHPGLDPSLKRLLAAYRD